MALSALLYCWGASRAIDVRRKSAAGHCMRGHFWRDRPMSLPCLSGPLLCRQYPDLAA